MSWFSDLFGDGGVTGFVGKITGIVDDLHTSDEERGQLDAVKMRLANETYKMFSDAESRAMEFADSVNDRALEYEKLAQGSGDKYTGRARPTMLYVCAVIYATNYGIIPILHSFGLIAIEPVGVPDAVHWLVGGLYGIYTGARTAEKIRGLAGVGGMVEQVTGTARSVLGGDNR